MFSTQETGAVTATLLRPGEDAWLVGGTVRDTLLHRLSDDVDLAVQGDCERLARELGDATGGAVFNLSQRYALWRVLLPDGRVDLTPLRGPTLADDLAGRDFTVNALARPLAGGDLIDPLGGRDDLRAGCLRPCSEEAFTDDPLRVMRLARLALDLGFEPAPGAEVAARAAADALASVSGERVQHELSATLALPAATRAVRRLSDLGALAVVLPELDRCRGVTQNHYHHHDVFEHTLEALDHLPGVIAVLGGDKYLASPAEAGLPDEAAIVPLAYAALLHDIAKPDVRAVGEDGRVMFWRHDTLGAEMAVAALRRLGTSRRFQEYVARLIREHLRLGFLVREMPLSKRGLVRYRRAVEPFVFEAIALSLADRMATRGAKTPPRSLARHFRIARDVFGDAPPATPLRLLDGDEVMAILEVGPGPEVGEALAALREEIDVGAVTDAAQARESVLAWWRERQTGGADDEPAGA